MVLPAEVKSKEELYAMSERIQMARRNRKSNGTVNADPTGSGDHAVVKGISATASTA